MQIADVDAVVDLQKAAFPPPFSEDLHWDAEHLVHHISVFPAGQFVAAIEDRITGSCSNAIIPEEAWQAHESWGRTVGGPNIRRHTPNGSTLYGLDITVHPEFRNRGVGRQFYDTRYKLVESLSLQRYGTGCRLPGFQTSGVSSPAAYAQEVVDGSRIDRVLTPLLRYNLSFLQVVSNYMEDEESGNAAALLEWTP